MKLVFNIVEGPKVKVGTITLVGNKAFSDRRIIRTMRNDRPYSIPLYLTYIPVMDKTFDRPKLDEDMEVGVRGLYQDNGYFRVNVNVSDLEDGRLESARHSLFLCRASADKSGKATNITIRIDEGEQYRMGTLVFRSADPDQGLVFKTRLICPAFSR